MAKAAEASAVAEAKNDVDGKEDKENEAPEDLNGRDEDVDADGFPMPGRLSEAAWLESGVLREGATRWCYDPLDVLDEGVEEEEVEDLDESDIPEGERCDVSGLPATIAAVISEVDADSDERFSVNLQGEEVDDAAVVQLARALRRNRHVAEVNVGDTRCTAEGLKVLVDTMVLKKIVTLFWFWGHPHVGDDAGIQGARLLAANTKVEYLALWKNDIGDTGARALAKALGSNTGRCKRLGLIGNVIKDAGAQELAKAMQAQDPTDPPLKCLQELDLRLNKLSHAQMKDLPNNIRCFGAQQGFHSGQ